MIRLTLLAAAVALAAFSASPTGAHTTKVAWTTYDAERRLEIGRFATTHGIAHATCLGTGPATGPSYDRRFKHLECKVLNKSFDNERHLVVHVRTETTFTPQWLTMKECA